MRNVLLALVTGALAASCTEAPPASGGFLGATSGQSTFTSAPDGCTYSFLFDDFIIRHPGAAGSEPRLTQARSFTLNAPAHAANSNVSIDVRGAVLGEGATGVLTVTFGGSTQNIELGPVPAEANFDIQQTVTGTVVAGANQLSVSATLTPNNAAQAEIHIDSVDLAINDAPFCGAQAATP